jgi:hypothetical protein
MFKNDTLPQNDPLPSVVTPSQPNYTILLSIIAALLGLILAAQLYTIYKSYQTQQLEAERAVRMSEMASSITLLNSLQNDLAADLFSDYQEAAYDNPDLERIAEQQLIAEEFQLLSAQMLSYQNQAIIELLALQFDLLELESTPEAGN